MFMLLLIFIPSMVLLLFIFLVVMFDIPDLHVACVSTRILVCLHPFKGILSLSHF